MIRFVSKLKKKINDERIIIQIKSDIEIRKGGYNFFRDRSRIVLF